VYLPKQLDIDDSNLNNDKNFQTGQKADAVNLGDKGTTTGDTFKPDWEPAFLEDIHAVIFVAGDSHSTVNKKLNQIKGIFGIGSATASIKDVTTIVGDVRPGNQSAHEQYVPRSRMLTFDGFNPPFLQFRFS